jgi:hypothetical protein
VIRVNLRIGRYGSWIQCTRERCGLVVSAEISVRFAGFTAARQIGPSPDDTGIEKWPAEDPFAKRDWITLSICREISRVCSTGGVPFVSRSVVEEMTGLSLEALSNFFKSRLIRWVIMSAPWASVHATMK